MSATEKILAGLEKVKPTKPGSYMARCPAHEDCDPSLSVRQVEGQALLYCFAGCRIEDILDALGLRLSDLYDVSEGAVYEYDDGRRVHRSPEKQFWQSGRTNGQPILYRCTAVAEAVEAGGTIYLVEGEKDVHALEAVGAVATTAPMGAASFSMVDASPLRGAVVVAVVDKDDAGAQWSGQVRSVLDGVAKSLTFVEAATGKDAADHVVAGGTLEELVPTESGDVPEGRGTGSYVDVAAMLEGGLPEPLKPTICKRTDGVGMFYPATVNLIFGDPEAGKTWIAKCAAAEHLADGSVLWIDSDHNIPEQTVAHLLALGVPAAVLSDPDRFRLYVPDEKDELLTAVAEGKEWKPGLAVVDSVGEMMGLLELNSNQPDDFTIAHRSVLRPLAVAGACVIAVDHLPKGAETRRSGPTGTAAKTRVVGGVSLRVTRHEVFAPGQRGTAVLSIAKDRPGGQRAASPRGDGEHAAGVFVLDSTAEPLTWRIETATAADAVTHSAMSGTVPTPEQLAVVHAMEEPSQRKIKIALKVGSGPALTILHAYEALTEEECSALPTPIHGSEEQ